jgi:hypothetical protein
MSTSSRPARSTEHRLERAGIAKEATEHKYPYLHQINTRILLNELNELSRGLQHRATLDDISVENLIGLRLKGLTGSVFLAFGRQAVWDEMCRAHENRVAG